MAYREFRSFLNRKYLINKDFRLLVIIIIALTAIFAIVIFILFLLNRHPISTKLPVDTNIFGNYGALVGGISAALLSLAGVLLIIQTINEQRRSNYKSSIESRFFELVRLHRENVSETESKGKKGRRVFHSIYGEWLEAVKQNKKHFYEIDFPSDVDRMRKISEIAYYTIFYGVNNTMQNRTLELIKETINHTPTYDRFQSWFIDFSQWHERIRNSNLHRSRKEKNYLPIDGHQSRLGHYFRHLFQTVNFINDADLSFNEKYKYIKTLRAQLSDFEQALFFLNSLTKLGAAWELDDEVKDPNKMLITKYDLIKNIPQQLLGNLNPKDYYPGVHFEYENIKENDKMEKRKNYT